MAINYDATVVLRFKKSGVAYYQTVTLKKNVPQTDMTSAKTALDAQVSAFATAQDGAARILSYELDEKAT